MKKTKVPKFIGWILWKLNICIKVLDDIEIINCYLDISYIKNNIYDSVTMTYKPIKYHYEFKEKR